MHKIWRIDYCAAQADDIKRSEKRLSNDKVTIVGREVMRFIGGDRIGRLAMTTTDIARHMRVAQLEAESAENAMSMLKKLTAGYELLFVGRPTSFTMTDKEYNAE